MKMARDEHISVARVGKGAMQHPKFLENIIILCFEKRFSKQNSVFCLKSKILPPQISGLATLPDEHVLGFKSYNI